VRGFEGTNTQGQWVACTHCGPKKDKDCLRCFGVGSIWVPLNFSWERRRPVSAKNTRATECQDSDATADNSAPAKNPPEKAQISIPEIDIDKAHSGE
jgi:hypothetical protein